MANLDHVNFILCFTLKVKLMKLRKNMCFSFLFTEGKMGYLVGFKNFSTEKCTVLSQIWTNKRRKKIYIFHDYLLMLHKYYTP